MLHFTGSSGEFQNCFTIDSSPELDYVTEDGQILFAMNETGYWKWRSLSPEPLTFTSWGLFGVSMTRITIYVQALSPLSKFPHLSLVSVEVEIPCINLAKATQNINNNSSRSCLQRTLLYARHHTGCVTVFFHLIFSPSFYRRGNQKLEKWSNLFEITQLATCLGLTSVRLVENFFQLLGEMHHINYKFFEPSEKFFPHQPWNYEATWLIKHRKPHGQHKHGLQCSRWAASLGLSVWICSSLLFVSLHQRFATFFISWHT